MKTSNKLLLLAAAAALALAIAACAPAPEWKQPDQAPPPLPPQGQWVSGEAVWYGMMFHGRATTSGQQFDMNKLTASHGSLPMGAMVLVESPETGKQVMVRVNDRHNLEGGQDLCLSKAAAVALDKYPQRRFPVRYKWTQ